MSAAATQDAAQVPGIVQLFEQSRPSITELPALRAILDDVAAGCATALREVAGIEANVVLNRVERAPLNSAMAASIGTVCSLFLVPEWNAQGLVGFSTTLLFRVLDAMYGGDGSKPGRETLGPERALTQLEQNVAGEIATLFFAQLQWKLEPIVPFSLRPVSVEQLVDASMYEKNSAEFALVHLQLVELEEMLFIALPLKGLELARDQLTHVKDDASHDLDPNWHRLFKQSVGSTLVELVASCEGPPMLLRDVAALHAGSVVEFDADCLNRVCLEAAGDRLFAGRLGQSKGYFTICLEAPVAGKCSNEDQVRRDLRLAS